MKLGLRRRRRRSSLLIVALMLGYSSLFTVYQTQQALVVRLGDPVRVVTEPGLHFKMPFDRHRHLRSTSASSIWKRRRRK